MEEEWEDYEESKNELFPFGFTVLQSSYINKLTISISVAPQKQSRPPFPGIIGVCHLNVVSNRQLCPPIP